MNDERLAAITGRYPALRIGVVGDFFLDRYLEIDPAKGEVSIETGLPDVFVMGSDGTEVRPVTRTRNWDGTPDWGPAK